MALSVPLQLKIQQALVKIGTTNGTALNEMAAPPNTTNEEATKWHDERQLMYRLLTGQQIEAFGKKLVESSKENMLKHFPAITEVKTGSNYGVIRGNVSCSVEVRSGRDMLDKSLLVSALAKRGMDIPEVENILKEATKTTAPAKHYKLSIIQDQG